MSWFEVLWHRWQVALSIIKAHPDVALALAGVGILLGICGTCFVHRRSTNALRKRLALSEDQTRQYKKNLQGCTPDEAKATLEALQTQLKHVTGWQWPPLTPAQSEAIKRRVQHLPKQQVELFVEDRDGAALAKTLVDLFDALGWPSTREKSLVPLANGIRVGVGGSRVHEARALADAIEDCTGLGVLLYPCGGNYTPIQVSIGVRPDKHQATDSNSDIVRPLTNELLGEVHPPLVLDGHKRWGTATNIG